MICHIVGVSDRDTVARGEAEGWGSKYRVVGFLPAVGSGITTRAVLAYSASLIECGIMYSGVVICR